MSNNTDLDIQELLKKIDAGVAQGYLSRPLPCPLDRDIIQAVSIFVSLSPSRRESFSKNLSIPQMSLLRAFAERMASLALDEQSEKRISDGLVAITIEGLQYDFREDYLILSLLRNSAKKLSCNFAELLEQAASYAAPKAAEYLKGFKNNNSSIGQMGYIESNNLSGLHYQRMW